MILLALLVSGGAFAQNKDKLLPNSAEAESVMAENVRSGKDYHEGLLKVYMVKIDASSYTTNETHYIDKTSNLISEHLGYSNFTHEDLDDFEEKKVVQFTFSGSAYRSTGEIKKFISDLGFKVFEVTGELRTN